MDKLRFRVVTDSLNTTLTLADIYGEIPNLLKGLDEHNNKDVAVSALFLAHDFGKLFAKSFRVGASITHLKAISKGFDQYLEWQMEGFNLGFSRLMSSVDKIR